VTKRDPMTWGEHCESCGFTWSFTSKTRKAGDEAARKAVRRHARKHLKATGQRLGNLGAFAP